VLNIAVQNENLLFSKFDRVVAIDLDRAAKEFCEDLLQRSKVYIYPTTLKYRKLHRS